MPPRCWRLARASGAVRSPSSRRWRVHCMPTACPLHAHCTPTACAGVSRLLRLWAGLHGTHGLRARLLYAEAAGQGVEVGDFDDGDIGGPGGGGEGGNDGGRFEGGGGEGAGGRVALLRRLGAAEAAAEAEEAVTHDAAALVVRLLRGAQHRAVAVEAVEAAEVVEAAEAAAATATPTPTPTAGTATAVGGKEETAAARRRSEDELAEQTHRADSAMVDTLQIAIWAELGASHGGARFGDLLCRGGGGGEGKETGGGDDEAAGEAEAAREVGESAELLARIWLLAHGGVARPRVQVCAARTARTARTALLAPPALPAPPVSPTCTYARVCRRARKQRPSCC